MTPRRITVNYGMTVNKGNYESERIDLEYATDLQHEENAEDTMITLFERLKSLATDLTGGFRGKK